MRILLKSLLGALQSCAKRALGPFGKIWNTMNHGKNLSMCEYFKGLKLIRSSRYVISSLPPLLCLLFVSIVYNHALLVVRLVVTL